MTLSVSIELVSSSARVTSVKFTLGVSLRETRHIDRTRRPGSDKNQNMRVLEARKKKLILVANTSDEI